MVEHWIVAPAVTGSTPVGHPIESVARTTAVVAGHAIAALKPAQPRADGVAELRLGPRCIACADAPIRDATQAGPARPSFPRTISTPSIRAPMEDIWGRSRSQAVPWLSVTCRCV